MWRIPRRSPSPSPLLPPVMTALLPSKRTSISILLQVVVSRLITGGQPVDLLHILGVSRQLSRADILLDLLRLGRAGDDAGHRRAPRQPAKGELQQIMAALGREPLEPLDERPVLVGQVALGRSRHRGEAAAGWQRRAVPVFAGEQPVRQRPERDQPQAVGSRAPASCRGRGRGRAGCTPPGTRRNGAGRDAVEVHCASTTCQAGRVEQPI